jgi:hypothetical protein
MALAYFKALIHLPGKNEENMKTSCRTTWCYILEDSTPHENCIQYNLPLGSNSNLGDPGAGVLTTTL